MTTFASRVPRTYLRVATHQQRGALTGRRFQGHGRLNHTLDAGQRQLGNARYLPLLLIIERGIHHNGNVPRLTAPQRGVGRQVTRDRRVGPSG